MKYDFCTLTDKNYVIKWLALCNSLDIYAPGSTIWVLCLDDESENIIKKLGRPNIKTVSLSELKNPELEKTRHSRTKQEFAWTCKPAIMDYVLQQKGVETMIFVDSDLLFYSSLDSVLNSHKNLSVMLTSHKFSEAKKHLADTVGYYNSGFIVFKNDATSKACVAEYKKQCIEWCYHRDGKGGHGDQTYLKNWPQDYKGIAEIYEKGINLGTWNHERYKITIKNDTPGSDTTYSRHQAFLIDGEPLICYHFHGFIVYLKKNTGTATVKAYPITIHHKKIYGLYINALQNAYNEIKSLDSAWQFGFAEKLSLPRRIKQGITMNFRLLSK